MVWIANTSQEPELWSILFDKHMSHNIITCTGLSFHQLRLYLGVLTRFVVDFS